MTFSWDSESEITYKLQLTRTQKMMRHGGLADVLEVEAVKIPVPELLGADFHQKTRILAHSQVD